MYEDKNNLGSSYHVYEITFRIIYVVTIGFYVFATFDILFYSK